MQVSAGDTPRTNATLERSIDSSRCEQYTDKLICCDIQYVAIVSFVLTYLKNIYLSIRKGIEKEELN